ncbi:MAG: hypothetical protein V1754_01460 [Pseudomonadota bacterium]
MKTRIHVTVDVECREERLVGGVLQPLAGYGLRVWGRFSNQSHDLGIGLIMREMDAYGFKATFYVDPFGSLYFGASGLTDLCHEIKERGHDLQMHAHPIQRVADWITRKKEARSDRFYDYSQKQQVELLREGLEIFAKCGIPKEEIVSFRAGHFAANNETWEAMAECGLRISSNYNTSYLKNGICRIKWPYEVAGLFDTGKGVWELPIGNFTEPGGGYRHAQVTAISLGEMKDYLSKSHRLGICDVTIVTHSFEFCFIDKVAEEKGRVNSINLHRLRGLVKYLDENRDRFEVETVGDLAKQMLSKRTGIVSSLPHGSRSLKIGRLFQQAFKRLEAKMPQSEHITKLIIRP